MVHSHRAVESKKIPMYVKFCLFYAISSFSTTAILAKIEGRLMSSEPGTFPLMYNISTILDFLILNPLCIYFLFKSRENKSLINSYTKKYNNPSNYYIIFSIIFSISLSIILIYKYYLSFLNNEIYDAIFLEINGIKTLTISGYSALFWTFLFISLLLTFIMIEIHHVFNILRINTSDIEYVPSHSDQSGGIKKFLDPSLYFLISAVCISLIFLIFIIQDRIIYSSSANNRLSLIPLYSPVAILLLIIPLLKLHDLMKKKKDDYLNNIRKFTFPEGLDIITSEELTPERIKITSDNIDYYNKIYAQLPEWPLPKRTITLIIATSGAALAPIAHSALEYIKILI
jgi:hypothetical protein